MRKANDYYALYKGDTLLAHGTLFQIHQQTGRPLESLRWHTYPTAKKRHKKRSPKNGTIIIKVEDI